jgi:hypothetical protein
MDDVIFTGNRVLNDLRNWITTHTLAKASIHIVTMAFYRGGQYYAKTKLAEAAKAAGKEMTFHWWRMLELEDRKRYVNFADVLRPRGIPQDPEVMEYATQVSTKPPVYFAHCGWYWRKQTLFVGKGSRSFGARVSSRGGADS